VVTNAGRWSWLDADHRSKAPAGVALGLLQDVQYFRQVIRLEAGDLVVLYSDGASEAVNDAGAELGLDGLMALAGESPVQSVKDFGLALAQLLVSFRASSVTLDDETVIVLRAL
jgi:sigma-B regulation protein RsbU (phosphoserine phosphatase)